MRNPVFYFSCALIAALVVFPHAASAQMLAPAGDVGAVSAPMALAPVRGPAGDQSPGGMTAFLARCAALAAAYGGPVPVFVDKSGQLFCGASVALATATATPSASAIVAMPLSPMAAAMPSGPCTASNGTKGIYSADGICEPPLCPPRLEVSCGPGHHSVAGEGSGADGCPRPSQCVANSGPCTTSGGGAGKYNGLGVCAPDVCPTFARECGPGHHAEINGGTGSDGCPIPPECVKDAQR
jgi:hypothetical protein